MKISSLPIVAAAGFTLAACSTPNGSQNSYQTQYDRLQAECVARDGALAPTGSQTGYPQRDYACRVGQATLIPAR